MQSLPQHRPARSTQGPFDDAAWRKSSHSQGDMGECVELAGAPGLVGVRDSKHPTLPNLAFGKAAFAGFTARVKQGALDL
ncbi:hypothetical protein GCM10027589_04540 [Actinocorallia lasiicapitis]